MTGAVPATWTAVLGWTLIHFLWQGTAIALALAMALAVLPRRAARIRYAAGCFALLLMLIVPAVTAWQLADPQRARVAVLRARAGGCRCAGLTRWGGLSPLSRSKGDSPLAQARSSERIDVATTSSSRSRTARSVRAHAVDRGGLDARRVGLLGAAGGRLVAGPAPGDHRHTSRVGTMGPREGRTGGTPRALAARAAARIEPRRRADRRRLAQADAAGADSRARRNAPAGARSGHSRTSWRTSGATTTSSTCCSRRSRRCSSITRACGGCRTSCARNASTAATTSRWRPAATPSSTRVR